MTILTPGRAPIEAKAQAAGVAGTAAGVIVYLLQTYVFKGTLNAGLVSLIYAAVPGVLALGAAYLAPHSPRPVPIQRAFPPGTVMTSIGPVAPVPPSTGPLADPPSPPAAR